MKTNKLALITVAVLLLAAAPVKAIDPTITLSPNAAYYLDTITVLGYNFTPNGTVNISTPAGQIQNIQLDPSGDFQANFTVPFMTPSEVWIIATDNASLTASNTLLVQPLVILVHPDQMQELKDYVQAQISALNTTGIAELEQQLSDVLASLESVDTNLITVIALLESDSTLECLENMNGTLLGLSNSTDTLKSSVSSFEASLNGQVIDVQATLANVTARLDVIEAAIGNQDFSWGIITGVVIGIVGMIVAVLLFKWRGLI